MPTKTESITKVLIHRTHPDLAQLYTPNMEVQVNVAQDGADPVRGEFKGREWRGYSDGAQTWKPFRIPIGAMSDPHYVDSEMTYDLNAHAEGIGMTGWDWVAKKSRWVAFDFDALTGHSDQHAKKMTNAELQRIIELTSGIEWVTTRKSTSGKGIHLYVFLSPDDPANVVVNHNEHAAVARAVLGQMSALTGFDFKNAVDICGGNMWVWHRKMIGTDGLGLIKAATTKAMIPPNWRDHAKVVTNQKKKTTPDFVTTQQDDTERMFAELSGQAIRTPLDDEHKKLIEWLKNNEVVWWWDADHHMLVTHTMHLKDAHQALGMKGVFDTMSTHSSTQNCFAFPLRRGAWAIRRFSIGCKEHASWIQDGQGWTRCFLNQEPDLQTAARASGGLEHPSGGFVFREAEVAMKAAERVGVKPVELPSWIRGRKTKLKEHRDGHRLVVEIERDENDGAMEGWLAEKNKWVGIFRAQNIDPSEPEMGNYDDILRHLVTTANQDRGWVIKTDGLWRTEPLTHVQSAVQSMGYDFKEVKQIIGGAINRPWSLVNRPFQPEYPGDRTWNRNAPQLRHPPKPDGEDLKYPTWTRILDHCGESLNDALKTNPWAVSNGITTGGDYLKCWLASMFQQPGEPLPYLFFHSSEQNTGKSIFHEAAAMLLSGGYMRADLAITSQGAFNAELEHAVLCVIEEIDLRKNNIAYNRLKDWVTSREMTVHEKGKTPFMIRNTTHWVQCSNLVSACPIFSGDTRITVLYVKPLPLEELIPKKILLSMLEKEASDFITELLRLELPPSNDRLNVPIITTAEKKQVEQANRSVLEQFIDENCFSVPGASIRISEFYEKFQQWVDPAELNRWTKIRVTRELPREFVKGRVLSDGSQWHYGNISWTQCEPRPKLILHDTKLISEGL